MTQPNVDPAEIQKFSELAHKWWDQNSEFKPLHDINPLRLDFIKDHTTIRNKQILDVGCGGGILSEGLAKSGATVTGIDLAKKSIKVAQLHALESNLDIDYRCVAVEDFAAEHPEYFDVISCMEMLEHVPEPESVVRAIATLLKPKGWAFFSTLNRNAYAYLLAVLGAEYILNILPKGTHDYAKFLKPSELGRMLRHAGLSVHTIQGMTYHPISKTYSLSDDTRVNYLIAVQKA